MFRCCFDSWDEEQKEENQEIPFVSHIILPEPDSSNPATAWYRIQDRQPQTFLVPMHPKTPIHRDQLRFVCVSDTHSQIENLKNFIPDGDVLLHAGNFTNTGQPEEIKNFNTFLGSLPHKWKVVIAGNQDLTFDNNMWKDENRMKDSFNLSKRLVEDFLIQENVSSVKDLLTNCIYLEDSLVTICGIKAYGSPWIPDYGRSAFNLSRGEAILEKWDKIPEKIDILLTHGPPLGYGDLTMSKKHIGCLELLNTIQRRVRPKYHVFGQVHEAYGITTDSVTTFINCSTCTISYTPSNVPIVFDVSIPRGHSKDESFQISGNT